MLNGDVLADFDLTAQLEQHERTGARATLALMGVEDPSAYGLVRQNADGSVREFVEKPRPDQIDSNLISAGAYILERDVLGGMGPAGTNISIEREVFPTLIGRGLFGFSASGYWLDIGTPERYLQGTYDIIEGIVTTQIGRRLREHGLTLADEATVDGEIIAPAIVGAGSVVEKDAIVGRAVLGRDVRIESGASVRGSVLLDGTSVGTGSVVSGAIIGPVVEIGEHSRIDGDVVIGEGAKIGPNSILPPGARIFPGVELPEAATSS
jgi:mannose-1-phosphate guanylyltransferase